MASKQIRVSNLEKALELLEKLVEKDENKRDGAMFVIEGLRNYYGLDKETA